MNQHIISAIEQKRVLRLQYKNFDRLVEPHVYGLDQQGTAKLLCYQTAGGSSSNAPSHWKMLTVGDILALEVMEERFAAARPGYKQDDEAMVRIYAQLQLPGLADWRG